MANYRSDPTANAAIGAIDRELAQLKKLAKRIRILRQQGLITPEEEEAARKRFVGIYRRFYPEISED